MRLIMELRYAVRALNTARSFALAFIITIGLAIGANASVFAVLKDTLITPLPNRDADRIIYVRHSAPGLERDNVRFSVPEIRDFRERTKTVQSVSEYSTIAFKFSGLGLTSMVRGAVVDGRYFEAIGLRAARGRLLGPSDDGPRAAGAVVLTHQFWTSGLGRDPNVVGKNIRLGTQNATIVGILEPAHHTSSELALLANVVTSPHHLSAIMQTDRRHRMTEMYGRLVDGATADAARAEIRALHTAMLNAEPDAYDKRAGYTVDVMPLRDMLAEKARTPLLVLTATAALVLLIACANLGNLLHGRIFGRRRELAIRAALGLRPMTLRFLVLLEPLLLSLAGTAIGILVAWFLVPTLAGYMQRYATYAHEVTVDFGVVWFATAVSVGAAVVLTFVPRLPDVSTGQGLAMAAGAGQSIEVRVGQRALVVCQVALAFVLLAGAGLLLRTLLAIGAENPGFDLRGVLTVSVPMDGQSGRTAEQISAMYAELEHRFRTLPGVRSVGIASNIPLQDDGGPLNSISFTADGGEHTSSTAPLQADFRAASPAYFETVGTPLLAGRAFTEADRTQSERVVIVSKSLVDRVFGGRDAVGRRIAWTDARMRFVGISTDWRRIVGVVGDVRERGLQPPPQMMIYHPFTQEPAGGRFFIKADGDVRALEPSIRRIVREYAPDQPVGAARMLEEVYAEAVEAPRLNAVLVGAFALVALAIAAVGVAGVLGYAVTGRTREFAIRIALGSTRGKITGGVLREGVILTVLGLVIGIGGALALARLIRSVLYGTLPNDTLSFTTAAIVLTLSSIVASAVPALRASRVDPARALRIE